MNLLELFVTLKINSDAYKRGIEDAKSEAEKFSKQGSNAFAKFGQNVKKAFSVIGKSTVAASAVIGKFVKDSISAFGEYEQLVGGVKTLFGDSADKVLEDSKEAFRTAGMSMNQYMETSIQSAAALIKSLKGDQRTAAKLMNMSIIDMTDNVNKMGTTMEAVQNAYRGFSRGNFTINLMSVA